MVSKSTCQTTSTIVGFRNYTPPRRISRRTRRENLKDVDNAPGPSLDKDSWGRIYIDAPSTSHLAATMHIMVPSTGETEYEVVGGETYDGLPPICCLEDLSGQIEEMQETPVLVPVPQFGAEKRDGSKMGGCSVQTQPFLPITLEPPLVRRYPTRSAKICKQEPFEELPWLSSSWDGRRTNSSVERKAPKVERVPCERKYKVSYRLRPTYPSLTRHEGKKNMCKVDGCGRIFNRRSDCERHEATHVDDKCFVCPGPGCGGKSYSRRDALFRHILSFHKEENESLRRIVHQRDQMIQF
ncbi:hypothetical protein C8R44DRAFT_807988 [Mycena epipterygia]|nr:hypothetical protein C8R44DRAFT_807988 [Mycena epipterygia]